MFFNKSDDDAQPDESTGIVPLLPLRDIIVFPHMVVPLYVGREKSIAALDEAHEGDKLILLAAQRKAKTNDPTEEDIYEVGTLSSVVQLLRLPDGTVKVLVECKKRVRIREYVANDKYFETHEGIYSIEERTEYWNAVEKAMDENITID